MISPPGQNRSFLTDLLFFFMKCYIVIKTWISHNYSPIETILKCFLNKETAEAYKMEIMGHPDPEWKNTSYDIEEVDLIS